MARAVAGDARDSELVVAARAGQAWALTEIWRRHAAEVNGYLRGRGAAHAEDLTSDVFLAVFERLGSFCGGDDDLRAYVFTIARHKLVDERRAHARRAEPVPYDDCNDTRVSPSAEMLALDAVGDQQVRDLLDTLTVDQRDVLLLRIIGDFSLERTAEILGKPLGAVKALQHRALDALRRVVEQGVSP